MHLESTGSKIYRGLVESVGIKKSTGIPSNQQSPARARGTAPKPLNKLITGRLVWLVIDIEMWFRIPCHSLVGGLFPLALKPQTTTNKNS